MQPQNGWSYLETLNNFQENFLMILIAMPVLVFTGVIAYKMIKAKKLKFWQIEIEAKAPEEAPDKIEPEVKP